jgi:hypothetical protein
MTEPVDTQTLLDNSILSEADVQSVRNELIRRGELKLIAESEARNKPPTFEEVVDTCYKLSAKGGASDRHYYHIELSHETCDYNRLETLIASIEDNVFSADADLEVNRYLVDSAGLSVLSKLQGYVPNATIHRQYKGTYKGVPVVRIKHKDLDTCKYRLPLSLTRRSCPQEFDVNGVIMLVTMKSVISEKSLRDSSFIYVLNENSHKTGECRVLLFDSPIRAKRITLSLKVDSALRDILTEPFNEVSDKLTVVEDTFNQPLIANNTDIVNTNIGVKYIKTTRPKKTPVSDDAEHDVLPTEDPLLDEIYSETDKANTGSRCAQKLAQASPTLEDPSLETLYNAAHKAGMKRTVEAMRKQRGE